MEAKPMVGFPEGRARLRLRCDDAAQAFIKTAKGIRRFYIEDTGDSWVPAWEIESNTTVTP